MSRKDFHFPEDGFRPIPNWVFNIAIDGKIDAFDCAIYSVIANVSGAFNWNLAGLVNRFKRRKVESSIKRLLAAGLISVEKVSKTELKYTAFDQDAYKLKNTTMAETYIDYGGNVHSTMAETYIPLCTKTPSKKSIKKRIQEEDGEAPPQSLPRADDSDSLDAPKLISLWNEETSGILPEMNVLKISRQTYDNISDQLLITPDLQTWKDVFGKLKKSDWARKKKIPFLMTLKPDFRDKVLSGLYDNADSTIHHKQRITGEIIDDGY